MNHKFDINCHSNEFEITKNSEVVDKLLRNLDSITLENSFVEQDLASPANYPFQPGYVIQPARYIVEIEEQYYLVDYAVEEYEPKPIPLTASSLVGLLESEKTSSSLSPEKSPSSQFSFASLFRKHGVLLGLGLGILVTLGTTRMLAPQTTAEAEESELIRESSAVAQTVTTTKVTTTDIDSRLNVSGTVRAYERTPVMSQIAGLLITDVMVERGDYVQQGQILAKLNNQVLQAEKLQAKGAVAQSQARIDELLAGSRAEEIAQAESRVVNARSAIAEATSDLELIQKRVERNTTLQSEGAISRDRLDEVLNQARIAESKLAGAKADLNEEQQALAQLKAGSRPQTIAQAQAELAQAQGRLKAIEAQLADTTITAPRGGIIASREAKVGQTTDTSEMLFTIIQDGRLELSLLVPETLIGKIRPGQRVQITDKNNRDLELSGKVREIDPLIDNSSRQATVKVDLPSGTRLKPGMFLQAAINTDTNQGLAVPIEALLPQSENKAIAFLVQQDNTVKAQQVNLGEILPGQKVEIVGGLQPGDRLVVKGAVYLKDGDKVVISQEPLSSSN
ncbi:MAG: efflux RND transporter periplasmic adaptor subunit [Cyanobacteria bacterium P01_G01_bin.67]